MQTDQTLPGFDWDGIERRRVQPPKEIPDGEFTRYMIAQFESLQAKMNAMHIDMVGHKADMASMSKDIDAIKKGFPKDAGGERDYDGHHDYHSDLIERAKTWKEIWMDVKKKVFGGVAWATVAYVAYQAWLIFKHEVNK